MAQLLVMSGSAVLRAHLLDPAAVRPLDAGRADGCWLHLLDEKVSRYHALFFRAPDGRWAVRDQGSFNGTFVNGQKISERTLKPGDIVQIGNFNLKYVEDETADAANNTGANAETLEAASYKTVQFDGFQHGRAMLESSSERSKEALKALVALADKIREVARDSRMKTARNPAHELLSAAAGVLKTALEADRVSPLAVSGNSKITPIDQELAAAAARTARMPISLTIAKHALAQKAAVMTRSKDDARFQTAKSIQDQGIGSAMCAPAISGDSVLALLYCDRLGLDTAPFDDADLDVLTTAALMLAPALADFRSRAALAAENRRLKADSSSADALIGSSQQMDAVRLFIARVAPSDAGVLISGESGTGKELAARAIHAQSPRSGAPLETVNCAAMTQTLIESELFGHVKGAFTGATGDRVGRFEAADGGTLFLDEIGELPLPLQTKLLRMLEYGEYSRVGETAVRHVDARIIAATNRNLEKEAAAGKFRKDLFYRLNILNVVLPPLRERSDDVLLLADHFLESAAERMKRKSMKFSESARKLLLSYAWPGNVRELRNLAERLAVLAANDTVEPADLPPEFRGGAGASPTSSSSSGDMLTLSDAEKTHILRVLEKVGGNKKQAADILGIDRSTLYAKLKQYGVQI